MTTSATISGQPSPNTVISYREEAMGTSPATYRRGSRLIPPSVSTRPRPAAQDGSGAGWSGAVPTVTVAVFS
ncbi:hypothetical protein GCM10009525_68610 [Streptosporangium amethystogenes subsp. fukuiense]